MRPLRTQCWQESCVARLTFLCHVQDGTDSIIPGYRNAVVSPRNVIFNGLGGSDSRILTTGGAQVCSGDLHAVPQTAS